MYPEVKLYISTQFIFPKAILFYDYGRNGR